MQQYKVGDRVRYGARFIRLLEAETGRLPFDKGTVLRVRDWTHGRQLVTVRWDSRGSVLNIISTNLAKVPDEDTDK